MSSAERPEFALIDWFRSRAGANRSVPLGIGDDAALVQASSAGKLVTVDMLMEGVHFAPDESPRDIGWKSLAVNLSDIAAMAGRPTAAFIAAAFSRPHGVPWIHEFYEGLHALAREFDVAVAGGDTNTWDGPFVVSVTVLGEPTGSGPVRRVGARVGDWIMVTGELGGSIAGRHLAFTPRVREAIDLHQRASLGAMIDLSDGLAADLPHILEESRVGAVLWSDRIPISEAARSFADKRSPLEHALGDGEDFELLFTVSPEDGARLLAQQTPTLTLTHIGEIVSGSGCTLIDAAGKRSPLPAIGWTHQI